MSKHSEDIERRYDVKIIKGEGRYNYTLMIKRGDSYTIIPGLRMSELEDFLKERFPKE